MEQSFISIQFSIIIISKNGESNLPTNNQNIIDMITDMQERVCSKCKYGVYRKSPIGQVYDTIMCKRNRSATKCYDGMYGDYEFV